MSETNGRWRRVIIEKPFGRDFDSARALNLEIKKVLQEHLAGLHGRTETKAVEG